MVISEQEMENNHPIYIRVFCVVYLFFTASAEESSVKRIGHPVAIETERFFINPQFSPDGNFISMTGSQYKGIFLYNLKSKETNIATLEPSAGFGMSWSKNSEWILYKSADYKNKRRFDSIVIFDIINNNRKIIYENQTSFPGVPKWKDNDYYITINGGGKFELFQSSLGKKSTNLSSKIIYSIGNVIIEYDLKRENEKILFQGKGDILNLLQSPDEKKLVFEVVGGNMWILDIKSLKNTNLGNGHEPAWNPKSDKIVYMQTKDDGHIIISSDIFVINADGTRKINLTDTSDKLEMRPDWHPNGKWIIYDLDGLGPIHIQMVE